MTPSDLGIYEPLSQTQPPFMIILNEGLSSGLKFDITMPVQRYDQRRRAGRIKPNLPKRNEVQNGVYRKGGAGLMTGGSHHRQKFGGDLLDCSLILRTTPLYTLI